MASIIFVLFNFVDFLLLFVKKHKTFFAILRNFKNILLRENLKYFSLHIYKV